jgi:hypothetical protein
MSLDLLRKDPWLVAAAFLAVFVGCFYASRVDFADRGFAGNDSQAYVALAGSLRSTGELRSTWVEGSPLHVKFPPGFPALLTPFFINGEFSAPAARGMMVVLCGLSVFLSFMLFRRAGSVLAFLVAAAVGGNGLVYLYGRSILSEVPYLVVSLLLLLCWERYERSPNIKGPLVLAIALLLPAVFLMRTVGAFLVLAIIIRSWIISSSYGGHVLARRALLLAPVVVVVLWWFLRQWGHADTANPSYLSSLTQGPLQINSLPVLAGTWLRGLYAEVFYTIPQALSNVVFISRSVAALALSAVVIFGLGREVSAGWRAPSLYVALYLVFEAAWPWAQTGAAGVRFMTPLVPFLLYYFMRGIQGLFLGITRGLHVR